MPKLPSFQFYPGDWMKDPGLRRCSHAARGVFMDLLCLMFESELRGVLASKRGGAWTQKELGLIISGDAKTVRSCIRELVAFGPLKVSPRTGRMYSKRMVLDELCRHRRIRAGRIGGKQKPSKPEAKPQAKPKQTPKQNTPPSSSSSSSPSTSVIQDSVKSSPSADGPTPEQVDSIWAAYPKKAAKKQAVPMIRKAIRTVGFDALLAKVTAYAACRKVADGYKLNPTTYFGGERWNDDLKDDGPRGQAAVQQRPGRVEARPGKYAGRVGQVCGPGAKGSDSGTEAASGA